MLFQIEVVESKVEVGWDVRVRAILDAFGHLDGVVALTDEDERMVDTLWLHVKSSQESAKGLGRLGIHHGRPMAGPM